MLSASFNQNIPPMSDLSSSNYHAYHAESNFNANNNPNSELYSQFFNPSQFVSHKTLLQADNHHHHSNEFDLTGMLTSKLQSMALKSNSAHSSPYDSRMTPRLFSQSTSNTPVSLNSNSRIIRDADIMSRGNPPIMQLFPTTASAASAVVNSRQSPVELIEYQSIASKMGFLVGQDLEEVLSRSATMKNSNSSRISNFFKHKHGSSSGGGGNGSVHSSVKQYLVLGVRVPSKEHVSEIVGKEGKKIKMIRQTTGALIATPNEKEDHVFLIEAVPETALKVGQIISQLAEQISRNKLGVAGGLLQPGECRPRSPPLSSSLGNRTPLATATIGVPQRLVGKVIGTQGSIITTVQKETGTEIKSPPKDELRAPEDSADFEISVYENGTVNSEETAWLQIHRAKQLIAHLVMRVWEQQRQQSSSPECDGHYSQGEERGGSGVAEWMWPEVSRMDEGEAKEIVDRILRSSKAKITPSTSSSSGDGLVVIQQEPLATRLQQSPPSSSSYNNIINNINSNSSPYKVMMNMNMREDDNCLYSNNNHLQQQHQQQQQQRNSFFNNINNNNNNDSAFYDQYYHQDNNYNNNIYNSNNCQDSNNNSSTVLLDSSFNNWCNNSNNNSTLYNQQQQQSSSLYNQSSLLLSDDIWKSDLTSSSPSHYLQPQWSTFGTIGDGRKRFSVASDDREDLLQ